MSSRRAPRSARPLGVAGHWRRRTLLHHVPIAVASAVVVALFIGLPAFAGSAAHGDITSGTLPRLGGTGMARAMGRAATGTNLVRQSTAATGYLALALLALTLLVGPANLLLRRRNPVSSYLRRDLGTWTAIASIVHVILGFDAHGNGQVLTYFISDGRPLLNSFGLGNWTGLAALVIVAMLLALSTDHTLRELKAQTWKDLQRLNYLLFALVCAHAYLYGALLQTRSRLALLIILTVVAVIAGQAGGVWLWRSRNAGARTPRPTLPTATSTRSTR
jgi:sulfoxide reductase heme-binding subunit YedZ